MRYSKEKQQEWLGLCDYVHKNILEYDDKMKFPKTLALRLKGLAKGQFIANNKAKPMAEYSFKDILLTFKMNKLDILIATANKDKFKDEKHLINYIMVIIESKINDVVKTRIRIEKENDRAKDVVVQEAENKAEYIIKTKEVKNKKLDDLW